MKALGIDLGTTSISGVLIDTDSGAILRSRTENSDAFIEGKDFERIQSPEKIIDLALDILEDLFCDDLQSIGVTGQMHGIVYLSEKGKAQGPLYTWQDKRGNEPYKGSTYAEFLGSHTGYGLVTDFYNRENGLVPTEAVTFCTIHDYLVLTLCGLKTPIIHDSSAASFGLFNLEKRQFETNRGLKVVSGYRTAGEYKGVPVSVAIGDNQASVFSSLSERGDILLNVGTGSQVSLVSDRIINEAGIETRPYFDDNFLLVGAALCGGRAYAILKDFFKAVFSYKEEVSDEEVYEIMGKMVTAPTEKLKVDTRFSGTRQNEDIRGSISGISPENFTPEALTKGLIGGMVEELYDLFLLMESSATGLVGSGNAIRKNAGLRDAAEAIFKKPLKVPSHKEEAAYGAALYSLVSSGFCSPEEARSLIKFN